MSRVTLAGLACAAIVGVAIGAGGTAASAPAPAPAPTVTVTAEAPAQPSPACLKALDLAEGFTDTAAEFATLVGEHFRDDQTFLADLDAETYGAAIRDTGAQISDLTARIEGSTPTYHQAATDCREGN